MTKKAEKYANLPDYVMGLTCSRHRVQDMKQILRYHNQRFMSTATKPELLGVMSVLEKTLRTPELAFVTSWLNIKGRKVNFYTAKARATQPLQKPRRRPESNEEKEQVEDESDIVSTNSSEPTECSVCMESFLSSQFPQERLASSCDHEMAICSTCVTRSIDQQIIDHPYEHISCPECSNRLQFEAIKQFASVEKLVIYTDKGFKEANEKIEGYTKCLSTSCQSGQIHGSGHDQPIMTCVACGFKTCYTHMMPWHTDKTCAQYDTEQRVRWEQEEATKKLLAETAKICPNPRCGYYITKNHGCNHMTCRQCKYEFCWLCFAPHKMIQAIGNGAHEKECPLHSDHLP